MLTQNSELRPLGIHNWTIPAYAFRRDNGETFNACPQAGACAKLCYARNGTYLFPKVHAAHRRNLERYLADPAQWRADMLAELRKPRFRARPDRPHLPDLPRDHLHPDVAAIMDAGGAVIRIHDAGDFFSAEYLNDWARVALAAPNVLFYAYTKEVAMVKAARPLPANLLICYSFGGKQDHLIDRDTDQHSDVFPTLEALEAAGYVDQEEHDLLCVVAPTTRVGIVANNIPHFRKKQGAATFSELELAKTARRHRKEPQ